MTTNKKILLYVLPHFVADSESREKVVFRFDNDPVEEEWRVQSENGMYPKSNLKRDY